MGESLSLEGKEFSLDKVDFQVVCRHPLRDVSQSEIRAATCVSDWGGIRLD